jgi:hypothetical protein
MFLEIATLVPRRPRLEEWIGLQIMLAEYTSDTLAFSIVKSHMEKKTRLASQVQIHIRHCGISPKDTWLYNESNTFQALFYSASNGQVSA